MPAPRKSETTPLTEPKIWLLTAMVILGAIFVYFWTRTPPLNDRLDPCVMNRAQKEWDHVQKEWDRVQKERDLVQEEWDHVRKEWDRDWHQHREQEEIWKRAQISHEKRTKEWDRERKAYEREKKEREHEEKEREREEDERQRHNTVWVDVEPHSCTSWATRKYTARLANVPSNYNRRIEACKATPLDVHRQSYLPHTCEDNVNGTIGTWNVNQNQPDCVTFWTDYKDKGCMSVGSGKRRIDHRLENLPPGGDWGEFSATTPVRFHGMQFSGAQKAFQSAWRVYGIWEIDDDTC
ncbi:hypothetical protein PAXINDRAFT_169488 [Paxillus involutus ATCC 200175]|uniref:Unplaced genomic scaffold PAXINscaffold_18, whole genome shotgun sequence n=1 Tax=Paxillus involutus ATCC 200175 TaxID=664439 RepID=A0A0C9TX03_PAXIN|nr:hypothetical protein PAXINDRAFT_169488 [Paxillus involutus ATCC 200175]